MCKCNVELVLVSHVDNFGALLNLGAPSELVSNLVKKGVNDEGYLFQCPVCGEYIYQDEMSYDICMDVENDKKVIAELSNKLYELHNSKVTQDDDLKSLKTELGSNLKSFLETNGKLIGNYELADYEIWFYQLKDSFAQEKITFKLVKDNWGKYDVFKVA